MDLTHLSTLHQLCHTYGITPDQNSGQHFLINRELLERAVAAANLTPQDTVLEVGAGFGTLTVELAQRVGRVVGIELDPKLYAAAKEILAPYKNVELIQGNFLSIPFDVYNLQATTYKLVSNLPYHITGRFFRKVFITPPTPQRIVVMVQQEVAQRITAKPGDLSVLGVQCQLYGNPVIIVRVTRENFWPQPEVDSAVVALAVRTPAKLAMMIGDAALTPEMVMRLVKVGFAARRKTLANNLRAFFKLLPPLPFVPLTCSRAGGNILSLKGEAEWSKIHFIPSHQGRGNQLTVISEALRSMGLPEKCRAQELSVHQWITLAKMFKI